MLVLVAATLLLPAAGAPVLPADIPAELSPWASWVLHGHEQELCPVRINGTPMCSGAGRLELALDEKGGTFLARWRVDAAGFFALPGDDLRWPLDVTVDGKDALVIAQPSGGPGVLLSIGEHTATGRFLWSALPESLPVPPETATLKVVVAGRELPFVDRGDAGDRVWLKRAPSAEEREEDRLDVAVFRKVTDGVPLVVETQVLLEVSGKGREVALPGALLAGFQPMALSGTLPVRVDGEALKVQVRPGRHTITFVQRNDTDVRELKAPAAAMGGEGSEEVWVFAADHSVRVVNVTGVTSIVPEQTRLPDAWRSLPAYRVMPGEAFHLEQQRRGDENPAPSQLSLLRTLWLDFDGGGFTVHDELSGRFTGDRLLMGPGTTLGRVSTADSAGDAFITRLTGTGGSGGDATVGVEVRSPSLRVTADSRIEGGSSFPAVSWAHDFQSVRATLHLPPGVKLFHAGGVDVVNTTWVKSWTLFELFLVVIITVSMARLWGPAVGGVALLCTVLTFQEEDSIRWLWIVVVVLAAIHRVVPPSLEDKRVDVILRWLRLSAAVVVALFALGFSIHQIRMGMYPVLEQEYRAVGDGDTWGQGQYGGDAGNMNGLVLGAKQAAMEPPPPPAAAAPATPAEDEQGAFDKIDQAKESLAEVAQQARSSGSYEGKVARRKQKLQLIDPNAVVQTGPGLPQWAFTTVSLAFTGPVKKDQRISLVLVGPRAGFVLALLRVLLTAVLVVVAFGAPGRHWPRFFLKGFRGKGALFTGPLLLALLTATSSTPAHAAEPSPATLEALRSRLLEKPACSPACASIARMSLDAAAGRLRLRAEVHALADVGVPLPGADQQWTAQTIIVDGRPWAGAARDGGSLWLMLPPGRHDVMLEGALPRRDAVQLALPLVPHQATFTSTTWTVDGISEDGVPGGNLQLSRVAQDGGDAASDTDDVEKGAVLPPFLSVERSLLLGLSFEVETRVVRLSPPGTAVLLEVPLLPGESVTTDGVRAEGGKAFVSLGPNDVEVSFSGALPASDKLVLEAHRAPAGQPAFVEVWSVEASPVWHVEEEGIPPLHSGTGDNARRSGARGAGPVAPNWRPWPGEKLTLSITRPQGVPGQTVTVERTSQRVRPGISSTDVTLMLALRSSRGGEHVVTLPKDAELLSATVDGRQQPLRPDAAGKVRVPLVPGKQEVVLEVRALAGVSAWFVTPVFDVGSPSVNAEIVIDVPSDRWILFATGPRAGPAVLFWSYIVVLLLSGVALSRVRFSPLRLHHWVLLGLGLTQVPLVAAALVAGWLLALGVRKERPFEDARLFNFFQLVLVAWTGLALIALVASIHEGLLGAPDMQIAGNGSSRGHLRWFQDHATGALPTAVVVNAPLAAYRLSMLAWALWLAFSLLGWLRAGFAAFSTGGMWRTNQKSPPHIADRDYETIIAPRPGSPATKIPEAPPGAPTSTTVPSVTEKE